MKILKCHLLALFMLYYSKLIFYYTHLSIDIELIWNYCCQVCCPTFQTMSKRTSQRSMRKMNRKSEDSLNLMLSQDDTERRMQNGLEDDDLHLWLSQSQTAPTQQSMDDTAMSDITSPDNDVQMNVREILNMIRHNHNYMVKQNDVLFKLVREVSVNVSEINDKIRILEKKFSVIEKAVKHNNNEIVELQHKVENLEKSVRILKEKQSVSVKADELEIRLKAMENKLNQRITERVNITDVVANDLH